MMTPERTSTPAWLLWTDRVLAVAALGVVAWACATAWGAIVHGHPAYAVLLALTAVGAVVVFVLSLTRRTGRPGWRRVLRVVGTALGLVWVATIAWLRPFPAIEPALAALEPDGAVAVTETTTQIVLEPQADRSGTGLLFQPGARVDPRAYAAVLRPLAEAGHTVVITKQPLGIGFLNLGALAGVRGDDLGVSQWVVGGHSLGGVVASIEAEADASADAFAPVTGLLLFASYPAGDISASLAASVESISGTEDGLSTPEAIEESRANLPADAHFTVIEGASHSQFGDYGPQPGDGEASISDDDARAQITAAALAFLDSLS